MGSSSPVQSCCAREEDAEAFVTQLRTSSSTWLQEEAACSLADFARQKGSDRTKDWMPDAIPILIKAVTNGKSLELKEHAARALANLTVGDTVNSVRIVNAGGVQALVQLLSTELEDAQACRAQAARALGNLSVQNQVAATRVSEAGGVRTLLKALLEDPLDPGQPEDTLMLHAEAACAIANLAAADESCRKDILGNATAVPRLSMLAQGENPAARIPARRALTELAEQSPFAKQALSDADAKHELRLKLQALQQDGRQKFYGRVQSREQRSV